MKSRDRRSLGWAAICICLTLAISLGAGDGSVPERALERCRGATVLIERRGNGLLEARAGYFFRKTADAAYVVTQGDRPWIGGAVMQDSASVRFGAGTPQEIKREAKLLALDPETGLAIYVLSDPKGLPPPMDPGEAVPVKETERVFLLGYAMERAKGGGGPRCSFSATPARVTSVIRDQWGVIEGFRFEGAPLGTGAGGPVIDGSGRLVGIAHAREAVDADRILSYRSLMSMCEGRILGASFEVVERNPERAAVRVRASLVDPFGAAASAGIAWMPEREIREEPKPDQEGRWTLIHPEMRPRDLEMKGAFASGLLELSRKPEDPGTLTYVYQCRLVRKDGAVQWTFPERFHVTFDESKPPVSEGGQEEGATSVKLAEKNPAKHAEGEGRQEMNATFRTAPIRAVLRDLRISTDGRSLFVLDLSDGRACRVDAQTMREDKAVALPGDPRAMDLSPEGGALYVAGSRDGKGYIAEIDAWKMSVIALIDLPEPPRAVWAVSGDRAVVGRLEGKDPVLRLVDLRARSVMETAVPFEGSWLVRDPDGARLFGGGDGRRLLGLDFAGDRKGPPLPWERMLKDEGGSAAAASPGGTVLLTTGTVLRLKASGEPTIAGRIAPCLVAAFSGKHLCAAGDAGVCVYDRASLKRKGMLCEELRFMEIVGDPRQERIYGLVAPVVPPKAGEGAPSRGALADLAVVQLEGAPK